MKTVTRRPSIERLRELFEVDEGGCLRRRVSTTRRVKVGDVAGTVHNRIVGVHKTQYRSVMVDGVKFLEHVIVYTMTHGIWPEGDIDHIDRNGLNNAPDNLRIVNDSENQSNKLSLPGSSSQYKGVSWDTRDQKWHAQVSVNRRNIHVGLYDNEKEAALYYDAAHKLAWPKIINLGALNFPPEESNDIILSDRAVRQIEATLGRGKMNFIEQGIAKAGGLKQFADAIGQPYQNAQYYRERGYASSYRGSVALADYLGVPLSDIVMERAEALGREEGVIPRRWPIKDNLSTQKT